MASSVPWSGMRSINRATGQNAASSNFAAAIMNTCRHFSLKAGDMRSMEAMQRHCSNAIWSPFFNGGLPSFGMSSRASEPASCSCWPAERPPARRRQKMNQFCWTEAFLAVDGPGFHSFHALRMRSSSPIRPVPGRRAKPVRLSQRASWAGVVVRHSGWASSKSAMRRRIGAPHSPRGASKISSNFVMNDAFSD